MNGANYKDKQVLRPLIFDGECYIHDPWRSERMKNQNILNFSSILLLLTFKFKLCFCCDTESNNRNKVAGCKSNVILIQMLVLGMIYELMVYLFLKIG